MNKEQCRERLIELLRAHNTCIESANAYLESIKNAIAENRLDQLQQSMSEESGLHGCMGIVKIVDFETLRERQGYELSDNLIRILADLLRQSHAGYEADRVSRMNGSVSLNIETRKHEREAAEAESLARENQRREAQGLDSVESLADLTGDDVPDVALTHAAEIVADLTALPDARMARNEGQ